MTDVSKHGVFWHKCKEVGCDNDVQYDDEPKCFTHSPDEGSSLKGYSAYAEWVVETADRAKRRTIKLEVSFENVSEANAKTLAEYLQDLVKLGVVRIGGTRIEVTSGV